MKNRISLLLGLSLLSIMVIFSACKKDDDDDKTTPLSCDRTIDGSITLGQNDFTVSMKVSGSGTYSVTKIEYLDADGNLQTLNNPDLPWEENFTISGVSGSVHNYELSMYTSVTNGKITAEFDGNDGSQFINQTRECSQYTD
ncbi:MAG: hypothetical protein K9G58_15725 [Bacteroidales bacterium]|nr:hypothetical protein [Bacteroidales bacterium]MCF8388211.1 hypothetical protein [Bacteroidales bacterium]MCF8399618.1 hypothetical protein [Bacteroidales bacterium]